MKEKIEAMLDIYRSKLADANTFANHADGLHFEGAVSVLENLLIYANETAAPSQPAVETGADCLCCCCEDIGRNGEHSYFCRKCGAPLN